MGVGTFAPGQSSDLPEDASMKASAVRNVDEFIIARQLPLPRGWANRTCPRCGSDGLMGAILTWSTGEQVTPTADESDPNITCRTCAWWD